jgi:cyclomaltodextrinase / maltogenic alpha-amylase / neopullulanase
MPDQRKLTRRAAARALRSLDQRPELRPEAADVWSCSLAVSGRPADATLTVDGLPLETASQDAGFTALAPLSPGPNSLQVASNRWVKSQTFLARRRAGPTARIAVNPAAGRLVLSAAASEPDAYLPLPLEQFMWSTRQGAALGSGPEISIPAPASPGEHYVVLDVIDAAGESDRAEAVFLLDGGQPLATPVGWQPDWVRAAVVYGVIPPLFGSPPLQAVTAALDRIAALGTTTLWLSPIFATAPGDFGYAVTDHFVVRPEYGDMADLQQLVGEAHERGLRVILDLPLNDTSSHHPYFRQAERLGASRSHYWPFYERSSNGRPVHYFTWRDLPNLSYDSKEVRRLALEVAGFWLREANVDGFRCDAAWGVGGRAPGFWAEWTAEVRRIRPDALLLAEAGAASLQWSEEGFSAAYDWGGQLGQWAWPEAFSNNAASVPALDAALRKPSSTRPFRFLDNNDTGRRFATTHGPGLTAAALSLLLSLPGIPCIYTGQEIGASYLPYRRTRPLDWSDGDPYGYTQLIAALTARRSELPALQSGALTVMSASPADSVLALNVALPGESLRVVGNFTGRSLTATVSEPGGTVGVPLAPWAIDVSLST